MDYPVSERRLFSIQVWSGGPGNSYSEDASHKPRALDISHTRVALLMVRDSFGEQGTLNTRVEPNYRQDLYAGRTGNWYKAAEAQPHLPALYRPTFKWYVSRGLTLQGMVPRLKRRLVTTLSGV